MLLIATLVAVQLIIPVVMLTGRPALPGQIALVIVPPWAASGGAAAVVQAAGGQEVGPRRAPFAVLAVLDAPDSARQHGAWAVLDGRALAQICGVTLQDYRREAVRG